jgi:catechol 2,3-dioxygenase-like lactoylglutathione lyase family enzyme
VSENVTTLRVRDLNASVAFYVEELGCGLAERSEGSATVSYRGYPVRLAGAEHEEEKAIPEGGTIYFDGGRAKELEGLRDAIVGRGATGVELVERDWGDRLLRVRDPDGYTICFWTTTEREPEEWLALYDAGPGALEAALAGLTSVEERWRRGPGTWSVREIVHHLADSEATVLARTKFGLAEPGRLYTGSRYDQDVWAAGLDYAGREIGPDVALFRAIRGHISQLMRCLPGAWERETVGPGRTRQAAGQVISMLVSHALEHIHEIEDLRRACRDGREG